VDILFASITLKRYPKANARFLASQTKCIILSLSRYFDAKHAKDLFLKIIAGFY
jgi:hypothetical protein